MSTPNRIAMADIAQYFGLGIEFSDELPAGVHGLLDASGDPRFIVVNSNTPLFEQQFTIAHELAHHVLHSPLRQVTPGAWIVNQKWPRLLPRPIERRLRLAMPLIIDRECQADIWAMCLLLRLGHGDTLQYFLEHHPRRRFWFWLALFVSLFQAAPAIMRRCLAFFVGDNSQPVTG